MYEDVMNFYGWLSRGVWRETMLYMHEVCRASHRRRAEANDCKGPRNSTRLVKGPPPLVAMWCPAPKPSPTKNG